MKLIGMTATAAALACVYACSSSGSARGEIKKGPWSASFGVEYRVTGPEDMCGCIFFTDENGNKLDGAKPGRIVNGSGGGVTPPNAKGWNVEITPCADWDGCEQEPLDGGGPDQVSLAAPYWFIGTEFVDGSYVDYDVRISARDRASAIGKLKSVVREQAVTVLPDGVTIRSLTKATPVLGLFGELRTLELTAYDTEPIQSFVVRVDDTHSATGGDATHDGLGYWTSLVVLDGGSLNFGPTSGLGDFELFRWTDTDGARSDSVLIQHASY